MRVKFVVDAEALSNYNSGSDILSLKVSCLISAFNLKDSSCSVVLSSGRFELSRYFSLVVRVKMKGVSF